MQFALSAPGKCFLVGEYLSLSGGPALLASIGPRFILRGILEESGGGLEHAKTPFHPKSPGGILWQENRDVLAQYRIYYENPYGGGGFGGSTAEFALLYGLLQQLKNKPADIIQLWSEYRRITREVPSGADLVSQAHGGLTLFEGKTKKIQRFSWNFEDIGFMIFKTPKKVATHEHLKILDGSRVDPLKLYEPTMQAARGLAERNAEEFIQGVRGFSGELWKRGLVEPRTQEILGDLRGSSVLAAKGCGALGADVVICFDQPDFSSRVRIKEKMSRFGCIFIGDELSLDSGMRVESGDLYARC